MTVRRGSLRYKIVRLGRVRRRKAGQPSQSRRVTRIAVTVAGRAIAALAIMLLSGTVAVQIWHVTARSVQLHEQIKQVESQNTGLTAANTRLETRAQRLHDPEYLVPLIHEQLGLAKPHEVFVEVTQATPAPAPADK